MKSQKLHKYTRDIDTNIYTNAAAQIGCKIEVINEELGYTIAQYNDRSVDIVKNTISLYSQVNGRLSSNKYLSLKILKSKLKGLIQPNLIIYANAIDPKKIESFFNKFKYVTVEPNINGNERYLLTLPKGLNKIIEHINYLYEATGKSTAIIKQYRETRHNYKFISYEGEIIDVIEETYSNVIGNGESTIQELIDKKNKYRECFGIDPIKLDVLFLKSKGLELSCIPERNKHLVLNHLHSLKNGGDVSVYDMARLHNKYKDIVKEIYFLTGFNLFEINIMSNDLTEDPYSNKTTVDRIKWIPRPITQYFARIEEADPLFTIKPIFRKFFKFK